MSRATETRHQVPFHGSRAAVGPLTWGQQATWDEIQRYLPGPEWWFFVTAQVTVPEHLRLGDVLTQIGAWIGRHEALRTHFRAHGGVGCEQEVMRSGVLDVTAVDCAAAELTAVVDAQARRLREKSFDHAVELPLRVVIVLVGSVPVRVMACMSHVTADELGASAAAEDLSRMLVARAASTTPPDPPAARQPIDQAAYEMSDRGRRANRAAIQYFGEQLNTAVPGLGEPHPHSRPRYREAFLRSQRISRVVPGLAAEYGVPSSAVFLCVMATLLRELTGAPEFLVGIVCHNRFSPMLRNAVGNVAQRTLATIGAHRGSVAPMVAATAKAALRAYRHAQFDPRTAAPVGKRDGVDLTVQYRFNDKWSRAASAGTGALPDLRRPTCFWWGDEYDNDDVDLTLYLDVGGPPGEVVLRVLADTYRIPDRAVEAFLRGFERLLEESARHHVAMPGIGRVTDRKIE